MWNVTSRSGKEPKLLFEFEKFWLDIGRLASRHSFRSGTSPLKRGRFSHSVAAHSERCQAGAGILVTPWLGTCILVFTTVDTRVVLWGETCPGGCLCLCTKRQLKVPTLFWYLGGGAGECSLWGRHCFAEGLHWLCNDWEEQTPTIRTWVVFCYRTCP